MDRRAIATWIKEQREARELSQDALAAAAGCTGAYISSIERHEKGGNPTTDILIRIVEALGGVLTIDEGMGEVTPEQRQKVEQLRRLCLRARGDYIDGFIRFLEGLPARAE